MQKPILIDLDGVLRLGNKLAEDTDLFLKFLSESNRKACILSNSSLYTSENIIEFFKKNSIDIELPIITAIDAASDYVKNKYSKVAAYTSENVIHLFNEILDFDNPEAVLIGDIGDLWNYRLMQTIFEYVRNGADLIAIHKNIFWNKENSGITLDAGPFIHGIEYAADCNALLIGKPSALYFQLALNKINCKADQPFLMLGDDLESDITGSKNIGAETILIYTGKTKRPIRTKYFSKIDHHVDSLGEVIKVLNGSQ